MSQLLVGFLFSSQRADSLLILRNCDKCLEKQGVGFLLGGKMNVPDYIKQWGKRFSEATTTTERDRKNESLARSYSRLPSNLDKKICGLCGNEFTPREDSSRLICYSRKCIDEYNKAKSNPRESKKQKEKIQPLMTKRNLERKQQAEIYEKNRKARYVYLMRSGNGYYKIGISKDVDSRLSGLRRQFPVQIEVIHQFACKDYRKAETYLHGKYSDKRVENEWFELSVQDVQWITALCDYELDGV